MIVMGSSLKVTPACDLPRLTLKNNGKLVIVNLQKTPLDPHADMRLFAKIDKVMLGLMKELDIEIPMYTIASCVPFCYPATVLCLSHTL
jgi:NAD-dependent SIR2 family protein deacetylase